MITNGKNALIYNQIPSNCSEGNMWKSVLRICVSADIGTSLPTNYQVFYFSH